MGLNGSSPEPSDCRSVCAPRGSTPASAAASAVSAPEPCGALVREFVGAWAAGGPELCSGVRFLALAAADLTRALHARLDLGQPQAVCRGAMHAVSDHEDPQWR